MRHLFLLLALALPSWAVAQTRPEVLAYAIPDDAIRRERGPIRGPNSESETEYYLGSLPPPLVMPRPGEITIVDDEPPKNRIAIERFAPKTKGLISRRLYKDGKPFGVWREWHKNGQLASEEPYFEGEKDGLFRHWDEQGQLVGQYQLTKGEGVVKIYDSLGRIVQEEQLSKDPNLRVLNMKRYEDDDITLRWLKGEQPDGISFSFYSDDSLHGIAWWLRTKEQRPISHGPFIKFDRQGAATLKLWAILGRDVDEETYAAAAAKDPTLPPYFADVNQYKTLITPEAKALLKHYREMPPVKIPLEFDAKGEPLPALPLIDKPLPEKETPQ